MTAPLLTVLPPLPPQVWLRPPQRPPFPLDRSGCQVFARARHGLFQGCRVLGLGEGDEVLVPAYHHGSEVAAYLRAGVSCRFYDVASGLGPIEEELDGLITPRTRALHLIHPLGIPQAAGMWLEWSRSRGLLLIEDAAQAWLATVDGRPVGSFGDLSIFSLYKTFGVADGGAVVGAASLDGPRGPRSWGMGRVLRRHVAWLASRSGGVAALRRSGTDDGSPDHELGDPDAPATRATAALLPRVFDPGAPRRRRRNYEALSRSLSELVLPALATIQDGASPFAFPIQVEHSASVVERLRRYGIDAFDFWSAPHPALSGPFPTADRLRGRVVALPVHQELRNADLDRIVRAVRRETRR